MDENFNLFAMINHAKKITTTLYEATYREKIFSLTINGNTLIAIRYKDDFENTITITFTHEIINKAIPKENFEAKIPLDFDIIKE